MVNERTLREALIVLAEQNKTQHNVLSIVMEEVAVLRETVRGLDPTFDDVFQQRKADMTAVDLRRSAEQVFDDLIRRLKAGEVC